MKAYVIQTWRDVTATNYPDILEHETIGKDSVMVIYVPDQLLIGYEEGFHSGLIVETQAPYLGAQEIVEGKRKGEVKEIELDDSKRCRLNGIIDSIKNPPSKGIFGIRRSRHNKSVRCSLKSVIDNFYSEAMSSD